MFNPSSVTAHIIPHDSTPRSIPFFIFTSPGNSEPSLAIGIISPTCTLSAPVTICTT